jgi:rhamnose transport system substrate-binding protein
MTKFGTQAFFVFTLAGALALAGCSGSGSSASSTSSGGAGSIKVAIVPKVQGVPYSNAMGIGGADAAKQFGFKFELSGPMTADPAAQAVVVRSLMQEGVKAIIVAPNDPDSMGPVLQQAQSQGISVATTDTDAPNSVRQVFVNHATPEAIGTALTKQVMGPMGDKGKFAIVSCDQTAQNLNSWINVIKKVTATDYPNAQIVDTVYAGEDEANAVKMSTDLINAHSDLTGLIGVCTPTATAVAKAVEQTGKVGKIFTTGVGTPLSMVPYLKDGSSSGSVLWDVENLGYLAAWAGFTLAEGKKLAPVNQVGRIGTVKYLSDTKELLLGVPLIITNANVRKFNY